MKDTTFFQNLIIYIKALKNNLGFKIGVQIQKIPFTKVDGFFSGDSKNIYIGDNMCCNDHIETNRKG